MSKKGIFVDVDKIISIIEWPIPKKVTKVKSFLGLAGYYKKYVENFSKVDHPMFDLLKNGIR